MTRSERSKLVSQNTMYWLTAFILPGVFHFGLAGSKFPWPVVLPILLIPAMLASNGLISRAAGETSENPPEKL